MKFDTIKISELVRAEYNPRKELKQGDAEYEQIKLSIQEFGYVDPIIINADYTIVGGHQRLTVLKDLGYDMVNVVIIDIPKDKERALNVALNKITGEWDEERLCAILDEISADGLLEASGFCEKELSSLMDKFSELEDDEFDVDAALDEIEKPNTKRGDVWKLGRHRLMCGDSTGNDFAILMNGNKADMVFTDPPYNISYQDLAHKHDKIKNDSMCRGDFRDFLKSFLSKIVDNSYVCCNWKTYSDFYDVLDEIGLPVKSCIVWDKEIRVQNLDKYYKQHEFILYTGKFGGEKTIRGDVVRLKRQKSDLHPTMKPVDLVSIFIGDGSNIKDIVLDLFGGSGSTLIACEQTNRICYMMELDEKYCDVIIKRWEELTGMKAELIE